MARKGMEKIFGQWVKKGSKKHKIMKQQLRHAQDILKSETNWPK